MLARCLRVIVISKRLTSNSALCSINEIRNSCLSSRFFNSHINFNFMDNKINAEISEPEKKKQLILMEYELAKVAGERVPTEITERQMDEMLKLKSRSQRKKYFSFLLQRELDKNRQQRRLLKRKDQIKERMELKKLKDKDSHIIYGLSHNCLFQQIRESTMSKVDYYRLAYAAQFNPTLVYDMSYEEFMRPKDAVNAAMQLKYVYSHNKVNDQPFHLSFCNVKPGDRTFREFRKLVPVIDTHQFIADIKEESYLDIYPHDKLVYLTPHANKELHKFDEDAIYIIGSFVDVSVQKPVSLAKAKRDRIKMARLPLDRYLEWGAGSGKCLTIDQMMLIMLDIKNTQNWEYALRHVPRRKLKIQ